MKVAVVIPTYNEAENIKQLIPALNDEFKKIPQHECHILIVDGNSPDGTGSVVNELKEAYSNVHLLTEKEKKGLGAAYVYGFRHAMDALSADIIVEMDGDFQHNPEDVAIMLKEIDNGYDYVVGSRFIAGGSIPKDWELYRKLLSWGGNLFSKVVLGMWSFNDFTSGFKASRVEGFANKLDFDNILSQGFAYKIDLLYRMHKLGAKIKEVPITFRSRGRGASKMEKNNFIDSLKVVLLIRMSENKNFFKFVIVGFLGLFTDILLSNGFRLTDMAPNVAASVAALCAMLVTFLLNNFWSFRDRPIKSNKKRIQKFVLYVLSSFVPIIFRYYFVAYMISLFGNTFIIYNLSLFVSISFGLIWNFTVYSKIIWKEQNLSTLE